MGWLGAQMRPPSLSSSLRSFSRAAMGLVISSRDSAVPRSHMLSKQQICAGR